MHRLGTYLTFYNQNEIRNQEIGDAKRQSNAIHLNIILDLF